MTVRTKILPKTLGDFGGFMLVVIFIPVTAIYQLFFALPTIYEVGSLAHITVFALGLFLLINIKLNMIGVMMMDTSIKGKVLSPPVDIQKRKLWRLCTKCEILCPPRSWHCNICETCILKRDHHCIFTACCIGHQNHRYFFMFLIYFCIGTLYSTIHSSLYFWFGEISIFANFLSIARLICPAVFYVVFGFNEDADGFISCIIFDLNLIGFFYSLVMLISQIQIISSGGVGWEIQKGHKSFDLGLKRNFELVLGKKMHLVWLFPFIESELPMDGIHWEDVMENSIKNK